MLEEKLANLNNFFNRCKLHPEMQLPLPDVLREKAIAYMQVHTHLNLGLRHESVLAYLPEHMQCEILLTQHRYGVESACPFRNTCCPFVALAMGHIDSAVCSLVVSQAASHTAFVCERLTELCLHSPPVLQTALPRSSGSSSRPFLCSKCSTTRSFGRW